MTQTINHAGLGASEISAVVGMNPFASPWDVWLRKTGQAPDVEQNEPMEWGHRLEPAIRQKYADSTGAVVHVPPTSLYHPTIPWARATPDGIVLENELNPLWNHLLQCKNVGIWVGKEWEAAPPPYVQLQEQWELFVTGLDRADVAALIGGNEYRVFTVHRDDRMIADLVTIASEFWRHVENRTEPKVDDSDACADHFKRRFARKDAIELVADADIEATLTEWRALHKQHKDTEKRIKTIRNIMSKHIAEAQADRVVSSVGTARLQLAGGGTSTNWKLIAELLGSTKSTPEEFTALVAANTKVTPPAPTLYVPREWSKEKTA